MFNLAPPTLWNIITVILWSTFSLLTSQLMVRNLFSPLVYLQIVLQYCLFWGTSSPFTFCVQNEEQEVTQSHRPLTTKVLGMSGIRCVYIVNFFCILFHVYICFLSLFMHMFRCRGEIIHVCTKLLWYFLDYHSYTQQSGHEQSSFLSLVLTKRLHKMSWNLLKLKF